MNAVKKRLHKMLAENEAALQGCRETDAELEGVREKMVGEANGVIERTRGRVLVDPEAKRQYVEAVFHRGMLNGAGR